MPRLFKRRIRRRHARKILWIVISTIATVGLVASALAPALARF